MERGGLDLGRRSRTLAKLLILRCHCHQAVVLRLCATDGREIRYMLFI
jgi:hypothetical protein